jgi:voltage-gated potassium channel
MNPITRRNNFSFLFAALVLFLLGAASMHLIHTHSPALLDLFVIGVFLLGMHSLDPEHKIKLTVYALSTAMLVLMLFRQFFPWAPGGLFEMAVLFLFLSLAFKLSWKQIVLTDEVDSNLLVGSVVLYLLLGLMWATVYLMILFFDPYAFSGLPSHDWSGSFSAMAYFSFVTLTTIGYGDITPVNSVARVLVYLEAISGLFYMAIIVSSIVSARLMSRHGS